MFNAENVFQVLFGGPFAILIDAVCNVVTSVALVFIVVELKKLAARKSNDWTTPTTDAARKDNA